MINKLRAVVIGSVFIMLTGCASTTIFPEANGNYSLVTTSSEQGYAEKDAKNKAEEYCTKMGKRLVVISHDTVYQGADKNNAAMIGLAATALTGNSSNPAQSDDDYQVKMRFTCK